MGPSIDLSIAAAHSRVEDDDGTRYAAARCDGVGMLPNTAVLRSKSKI